MEREEAKLKFIIKKPWSISESQKKLFNKQDIEQLLNSINPIGGGNFFLIDFYHGQIITGSSSHLALTGHAKDSLKALSFDNYAALLPKKESEWLNELSTARGNFLYNYPPDERTCLVFHYSISVQTAQNTLIDVHHKFLPYQFDKNGNLWLGLCFVSLSLIKKTANISHAVNTKTGRRYDLINGEYQATQAGNILLEDLNILRYMANEYTSEQICELLGISDSTFKRKKRALFKKLGVCTAVGAIHKAHLTGLI